jgi:site-specific DNA recombinase
MGGRPLGKNTLFQILTNRIYLGKITYKDEIYDGEHPAIVDAEIFERTQRLLKRNGRTGGANVRNRHGALLKGLVRCVACDCAMVPSHTMKHLSGKGSKVYRYYCCANAREHGWNSCPAPSVPAPELERFVIDQVKGIGRDTNLLNETLAECRRLGRLETADLRLEEYCRRNSLRHAAQTDRHAVEAKDQNTSSLQPQVSSLSCEACVLFDPLWETLSAREQARILHLLIERVDYDGPNGTVEITFHPTGIKTLADELKRQEATTCDR